MARTEHFDNVTTISLPVPENTESGDPVVVGAIAGVALTDRGAGGNAPTFATVAVSPCTVHRLPVVGEVAAGDPVYIAANGTIGGAGDLFGFAAAAVPSATTATIPVILASPQADVEAS